MNDPEIKQAIDVCRPDTDDPRLPEISTLDDVLQHDEAARRLYEKTQQSDTAIAAVFRDVPVPDGLSDRLLAAVGEQASLACGVSICNVEDLSDTADDAQATARSIRPPRLTRWQFVAIGLSTVAASVAFCLVVIRQHNQDLIPNDRFSAEVAGWIEELDGSNWNEDLTHLGLQGYPLDTSIRQAPNQWCRIKTPYDSQAVVYDLAGPGRGFALAFCIRPGVSQSSLSTVPTTIPTTGGKVVAVWQRGEVVYVLAVQGDRRRYRRFVESGMIIGWNGGRALPISLTGRV